MNVFTFTSFPLLVQQAILKLKKDMEQAPEASATGISALKFMQKAVERKRLEAQEVCVCVCVYVCVCVCVCACVCMCVCVFVFCF